LATQTKGRSLFGQIRGQMIFADLISQSTHALVYSAKSLPFVIKARNPGKDINSSFLNYERPLLPYGLIASHELLDQVYVITSEPAYLHLQRPVIQEKILILSGLIAQALAMDRVTSALGYLTTFTQIHTRLIQQGFIDKLFTTKSTDRPRKFLENIGFSLLRGRYLHVDPPDLTDTLPSAETFLSSLENLRTWFPYKQTPALAEHFELTCLQDLRALRRYFP
jgi:hypothetical protein